MQINVKDTRIHKITTYNNGYRSDRQNQEVEEQILVAEAKLVLVKDLRMNCMGLIRCIKPWKSFIDPENDHAKVGDVTIGKNSHKGVFEYWEPIKPILISETEEINAGDIAYYANTHGGGKFLVKAVDTKWGRVYHELDNDPIEQYGTIEGGVTPLPNEVFKVLALPEHFSTRHLEMIISGELKDGDKVFVECEEINNCTCGRNPLLSQQCDEEQCSSKLEKVIKLTPESMHVSLHLIQPKVYTENEVRELLYSLAHTIPGTMLNVAETNNFFHMFCNEKLKK